MAKLKANITNSKNKKAIGYARISQEKQNSIGNQVKKIKEYAEKNSYSLIEIFKEAKSASKLKKSIDSDLLTDRPILQEILDKAKRHEFTDLILYHRDRLSRNFYEYIIIKSLFIKERITIHYVMTSENVSDTNKYIEKFTDLVFSNIAMLEAGLIGQRAKSGQKLNIENGYYAGGKIPYGYNLKPCYGNHKKTFQKDTSQEIVVERIFALYNLRFSYSEIIEVLKKEFPSENDIKFTKSTISQIINNEMYTGSLIWNKKSKHQLGENDTIVKSVEREEFKIIPSELFNRICEIKNLKSGTNNLSYKSRFLLKGKLICGNCGNFFKAKNNGNGKRCVYYCECVDEKDKYNKIKVKSDGNNNGKSKSERIKWKIVIPQDKLEAYVFKLIQDNLAKLLKDTNSVNKYYLLYFNKIEKEKARASEFINAIQTEINEIDNTIYAAKKIISNKLSLEKEDSLLYGTNFFEAIRNTISLVGIRKNELERQIIESKELIRNDVMTIEQFKSAIDTILSSLIKIKSLGTSNISSISPIKLNRMLIDDIIDKIVVSPGINGETLSIYLRIPNISSEDNFAFLQTCPINNILNI